MTLDAYALAGRATISLIVSCQKGQNRLIRPSDYPNSSFACNALGKQGSLPTHYDLDWKINRL